MDNVIGGSRASGARVNDILANDIPANDIPASDTQGDWPVLKPVRTGIRGRCPRCGQGHLFHGFLTLRDGCEVCGLSYAFADPADGPAFFVQCFGCVPVVIFALVLQVQADPPFWVHLVTSLPLALVTCVLPLRPLKGWLTCSQYFFKAGEGRLASD
ncbi:Uncharacterized conserved protein, DUF983 family [Tistlia consotensis]|uniref:Uncharacterized conserved protein, DUF983 family n=1 Tax=Tistlia consotensis USBA 355 TaxID=560819 RepID=A0A1Y6BPJ4_9PROT|nr:DUF983 domain-containing protein [Tistlia consotensis]SMF13478.1 Uncharacterized conserved protein, DUF983 family [Tistlia consotensis USBA 355]SNR50461.1 Uncharacterized conserved protein, DUF983 family [Tistlia consotensis]